MATVTESQFAPGPNQPGDIWIRLSAGGVRQRHEWLEDKFDGQAANYTWVGWPPQGGAVGLHAAKLSGAHYHGTWVGAQQGLAIPIPMVSPAVLWTLSHNLAYALVDVTVLKAQDDWTYNPGTQTWTDPQATTRPVTIVMPRVLLLTPNITQLQFEEPVRGTALVRR